MNVLMVRISVMLLVWPYSVGGGNSDWQSLAETYRMYIIMLPGAPHQSPLIQFARPTRRNQIFPV